ncbi:outer membrane beta-barrel protein [Persicobacter sp. CCB-QB2]|uniref:outer membrane beta-barrel protein n=1 Tax=Persicobacter sp. CCB-QB2 TaxID=1561025 RepID=UPI00092FA483|nr:outer membrane beta-barrel protein [Persicobacter sp. CCB-QB2]
MKKLITCCLLLMLTVLTAKADSPLGQGGKQLNFGLGFANYGIPVTGSFQYGVHRDMSVEAELSWANRNVKYNKDKYYRRNTFGIVGRFNYHFNTILNIPSNFDLYAGANVGFRIVNYPYDYYGNRTSGLGLGLQVGGRYYFNDQFGINLEFAGGRAVTAGKIGISIRF